MRREVAEPDEVDQLGDPGLPTGDPMQLQRKLDVLRYRSPRQEPRALKRDAVILVEARLPGGLTEHLHRTGCRLVEVGDEAQQGRFSASARSYQGHELSRRHREAHIIERRDAGALLGGEDLGDGCDRYGFHAATSWRR